ncbi:hypothetical protein [Microbacterium indicum]|uniref:hypothetical protein n=1 Tax=Microbacterium indicum TaxID=358100 RepID=UPI0004025488|nr:hypothetical protein [Microbacterium indicum]
MRSRTALAAASVLATLAFALVACGGTPGDPAGDVTEVATETTAPAETPTSTPEPTTQVAEIAPFDEQGQLNDGWAVDEEVRDGSTIPGTDCTASSVPSGENTVACGPTAASLTACWRTEVGSQIACLDETGDVGAQRLQIVHLGSAVPEIPAGEDPIPVWVELDDGSVFRSVHGGAWSPPEGYLVAYAGGGDTWNEIVVPVDDSAAVFDTSSDMWTVTVAADGQPDIDTRQVVRAWCLAGRVLPAPEESTDGVDGRWCEAPQSMSSMGCVTIDGTSITYQDGSVYPLSISEGSDGLTALSVPGAPLGTLYPAGTPIPTENLMGVSDDPSVDRLWSSQSGTMLIRG